MSAQPTFISADDVRRLTPYPAIANSISDVLQLWREGQATAPERMHIHLTGGGTSLIMPAFDRDLTITKIVTVHPANSKLNLPTVQGSMFVSRTSTGKQLGIVDAFSVTARRTAALSLLAAQKLAREPYGPLLVIGAGTQARAHIEAFRDGLGTQQVFINSRTPGNAQILAGHARSMGMDAITINNPEDVLDNVSTIVTATTSFEPVISAKVNERTFIAAVGAYTPLMAELPPELLFQSRLYADTLEGAMNEAGDYIRAGVKQELITPLHECLNGVEKNRGPVIFKSTGHALFDLAAAKVIFKNID